jgi:parallel beta-helix repeat protein
VFIELFNADGCAASKAINPIIEEIVAEYENTEVILVEMAGWGIYSTEETSERFKWYFSDKSELHTPSVCFDGLNQSFAEGFSSGGGGNSVTVVTGGTEDTEAGEVDMTIPDPVIANTETPVIVDSEDPEMVYPQRWATGDGTANNPWANDCIQKALDFVPAGGTIFLKAGYYTLSGALILAKQINIIGEGMGKTIVVTANAHGFYSSGVDYVTIKNLTIDGDAQTTDGTTYVCCIAIGQCDYVSFENIEVKNAGRYGIDSNTVNHSSFLNIYSHDNYRHGVHTGTDVSGNNMYNTYRNIYAWNNGLTGDSGVSGFDDRGNETYPEEDLYNLYDNLQCWDNEAGGITIANQKSGILSNSSATGNRIGIYLGNLENFNIHDCIVTLSEEEGMYIKNSDNINVSNVVVKNGLAGSYGCGILVYGCTNIVLTSCQSYDDRGTPIQLYGLRFDETNTGISLLYCKLTPNKYGEIYNPAGAVIMEEIKLARL